MPEGDGDGWELPTDERELRMPERMAIPKVPAIVNNPPRLRRLIVLHFTASEDCQGHVSLCLLVRTTVEYRNIETIGLQLVS